MFNFLKELLSGGEKSNLKKIIDDGAFLVDVQSPAEFAQGSVRGSVNIPVDQIEHQLSRFRDKAHIVVFCRSGMRSNQAKKILERNGIPNVSNGGTWNQINQILNS
ncbi:MAG: rhodanese-like domain-containing protein [Flavobacterium sp.]|nr:MAG: rhodanese-like domain-containing protein [Flavobacterium sp.]